MLELKTIGLSKEQCCMLSVGNTEIDDTCIEYTTSPQLETTFFLPHNISLSPGKNIIVLPYRLTSDITTELVDFKVAILVEKFEVVLKKLKLIKIYITLKDNESIVLKGGKPLMTVVADKLLYLPYRE